MKVAKFAVLGLATVIILPPLIRLAMSVARDAQRYGRMREMSDKPLPLDQLGKMVAQIVASETLAAASVGQGIASLPSDVEHYIRIRSM